MRFTVGSLGLPAVLIGLLGSGLAVAAYYTAALGYRRTQISLRTTEALPRDAWPFALATAAAIMLGVGCAGYLLAGCVGH